MAVNLAVLLSLLVGSAVIIGASAGLTRSYITHEPYPSPYLRLGMMRLPLIFLMGVVIGFVVMLGIVFVFSSLVNLPYHLVHTTFVKDASGLVALTLGSVCYGYLGIRVLDRSTHYSERSGIILASSLMLGFTYFVLNAALLPHLIALLLSFGSCAICGMTFWLCTKICISSTNPIINPVKIVNHA